MAKHSVSGKPLIGKRKAQHFDYEKTVYVYNKVTGLLEEAPEKINVVEQVNSFAGQSLQSTLERLHAFDKQVVGEGEVYDYGDRVSDLSSVGEALDIFEEYRMLYRLPDDWSLEQVYDYMNEHVKDAQKMQSETNTKKEVENDGKISKKVSPVQPQTQITQEPQTP